MGKEEDKRQFGISNFSAVESIPGSNLLFQNIIACEWLSTEEAAHFLSVSANALRIMVYRNQIPVFKFGRRLRFRLKDCQALFKTKGASYGDQNLHRR